MSTVDGPFRRCDGVTRREFLRVGTVGALGLSLSDLLRLHAAWGDRPPGGGRGPRDVSCILIWLDGGPSHLDTFDPKPDAPLEIRGEFRPIATNVPGIRICEHLPLVANQMDQVAVIRSLTSSLGDHDTASQFLLTGSPPTPALDYPSYGAVLAHERGEGRPTRGRGSEGARERGSDKKDSVRSLALSLSHSLAPTLPPYVAVPGFRLGAGAGYLPADCRPFAVGGDPSRPDFRVQDLAPPPDLSLDRLERRRAFLKAMDAYCRTVETGVATRSRDASFEQAYRVLTSPEAKQAFDLGRETSAVRERYGRHRLGQSCLLARRLIEAGVRFVTVTDNGWDHHQNVFRVLKEGFPGKLPALDQAYSALLEDLRGRGMLASTLVLLMGEFGRTPKINSLGGRDHWPRASFVCLAGGGARGGQIIGATDSRGEAPDERPVSPQDLAQTIYALLGVDARKEYHTPDGRPVPIVAGGEVIREVVG